MLVEGELIVMCEVVFEIVMRLFGVGLLGYLW